MIKHVCSLGTICHTGRLMQRIHLKKVSYPFDWVFSDEKIIVDCLSTRFEKFLDKSYYVDVAHPYHEKSCGHSLYHEDFFFHKDPRRDDDYEYYKRCVDRFNNLCQVNESKLFILMYSPQTTRHPEDLYRLFEQELPKEQIIEEIKDRGRMLNLELRKHAIQYRLLIIMNFGGNETQSYDMITEGVIDFMELNTISPSQGVTFNDGTYNTNRHPDNYYISGLMNELYRFH
jgi:hypothetical protein